MGSKKRDSSSKQQTEVEHVERNGIADSGTETTNLEPVNKKMKKEENKRMKREGKKEHIEIRESENQNDATAGPASSNPHKPRLNLMERIKHRKLLDKGRHGAGTKSVELAPEKMEVELNNDGSEDAGTSKNHVRVLPEFHIGVFKNLAASDSSVREAAAKALVLELREVQNAYEKLENKDEVEGQLKLEAEKDDGLNNCAPSVRYAVRRLIRGVSSSRECARQGFSLGLTILVGTVSSIKLEALLKLTSNLLEISPSMKGQEARDCLLGRLFSYGAIARSGKLTEEWISDRNTGLIREFTSCLIGLATKKRYLQEPAVAIMLEMVGKLPAETVLDHVLEAPGLQEWFAGATEAGNPDALLLALKVQEIISVDDKYGKLLPSPYNKSTFFATDHLSSIANCLKESTFCQPRVHGVWPVLISYLLPDLGQGVESEDGVISVKRHKRNRKSSSAEKDLKINFQCFCEQIIEGSLLLSSHDRKKLAFDVILLLLPNLPAGCVHLVLSYKVVQCLMDILSSKDSWLYKVAQHFLKELSEWVTRDDVKRAEVIVALQKHSNGKFDCITRSKTVKDLMLGFKTESGCILFIQNLIALFLDEGHSSEEPSDQSQTTDDNSEIGSIEEKDSVGTSGTTEFLKSWVVESLTNFSKHLQFEHDARFHVQKEVVKFLAVQGLFSSSIGTEVTSFELQEKFRWPKSANPKSLSQTCIEQLQWLLANAQKGEGSHTVASGVEANDLGSYFMRLLNTLYNIPSVSLSSPLGADDEKVFKKLQAMEGQLSREERNSGLSTDANRLHALRYLLIQLLLQIILRPRELCEAATELLMCCKKAFGSYSSGEDEPDEEEEEEEDTPDLMDVLFDTMLSLLPQSSTPLRSAIEQVFKYFCDDITDDGLLRMLRVIKKDLKPARHQNTDDEDGDDEDLLGVEEEEEYNGDETGETAESEEHTDDSEVVGAVNAVAAELPDASDDDSDEGMDDEEMFRMDTYLARIFREKKNQAGSETAHSQLVLFKLRVLSLLEIYLHENPGQPQVLMVFSNLAQAFANPQTTEGSEQLGQRLWGIIQKKIFKARDHPKGESVHLATIEPLLEKYLKLAGKPFKRKKSTVHLSGKKLSASLNRHRMIISLAQSSTFWLLKIIDAGHFPESELQRVRDIFQNVLVAFFDSKKSQIKGAFLKEILRRRPWIGHHLLGFLLEKCSCARSNFRQVEALDLVIEVLKPLSSSSSDDAEDGSKTTLKSHLPSLCHLIKHLVTNMPKKQSRLANVRKFCNKVFQMLTSLRLGSCFIKTLGPDGETACESQLGEAFAALKKQVSTEDFTV